MGVSLGKVPHTLVLATRHKDNHANDPWSQTLRRNHEEVWFFQSLIETIYMRLVKIDIPEPHPRATDLELQGGGAGRGGQKRG